QLAAIGETVLIYPSTGGRPKARRTTTELTRDQQTLYNIFELTRWAPDLDHTPRRTTAPSLTSQNILQTSRSLETRPSADMLLDSRETGRVDVTELDADPLRQLSMWLDAARAAGQPMAEAMTIASATGDGVPSARLVVLRGLRRGLVFFTDCESDKGAELAANPRAAAVLHWLVPAHRQVRVAGPAERVSQDEADEYWSTRAGAVRLVAAASRQSRVVASRAVLETQVRETRRRHPGGAGVPRPQRWGGFRVLPSRVEFWQESPDGLHDRIRYRRAGSGWIIERLSP
ncbi:MAG TPA: pyridoxamine 5'-phosphate oxidase, partial [Trebonia sp.]|nr:pyridoxamine 5'-phosphate oxidase [Trebonia sp.]